MLHSKLILIIQFSLLEDRKHYDQVSPIHEYLRKSKSKTTTNVRPNYDQGGQKIENSKL